MIIARFKHIEIYGADFDGVRNLAVINKNGEKIPVSGNKHFYDESVETLKKYKFRKNKTIADRVYQHYLAFYWIELLAGMATALNIKVKNNSTNSLIDAF